MEDNRTVYSIPEFLARISRGKKGSRPLTREEARWMLGAMLKPDADEVRLGAFLTAQRIKEETEDEIAGFIEAARDNVPDYGKFSAPAGAVDLPCYAGKRRSTPLHLVAAMQAKERGIPVVVHGPSEIEGRVSAWQAIMKLKVRRGKTLKEAAEILEGDGIVWIDISDACPELDGILKLKSRLGFRTLANSVARMLNPLGCDGQLNGVSHTPFLSRMCKVNGMTGQKRSLIFMGMEGEPELRINAGLNIAMQNDGEFNSLECSDLVEGKQPNPQMDIGDILKRFQEVFAGGADESESFALKRINETFDIASTGNLPDNWAAECFRTQPQRS